MQSLIHHIKHLKYLILALREKEFFYQLYKNILQSLKVLKCIKNNLLIKNSIKIYSTKMRTRSFLCYYFKVFLENILKYIFLNML